MSMSYVEFLKYTLQRGPTWKGGVSFQKWFRASMLWRRSAIAAWMLNSSTFALPLTHTAVPAKAAAGTTGTFTRATTSTWQNNDGYMVTGVAGEIGFPGARRVYNQVSIKSDDNTVGSAVSANVTVAATTIAFNSANASYWYKGSVGNSIVGHTYMVRAMASCTVDRTVCFRALELSGGGVVSNVALTSTPQEISLVFTASVVGTIIWGVENRVAYASDTGTSGVITFTDLQIADVTAETDQTTPREYVSVGVESAPYYHGSMVDGVKCFPTDINGVPLTTMERYKPELAATNLCLQSNSFTTTWVAIGTPSATQNVIGPDGATSAWTLTDDSAVSNEGVQQNITPTAANHTFSIFVKKTTGAQASYPVIDVTRAGTHIAAATIDTTNGTATVWTAYTGLTIIASSARCESFNANFWRVSLTYLGTAVAHTHNILAAATTNATQSTGTLDVTATGSAVFYGAQVELGTFASSYIATTTIAVTRNADVLTYSGGDIPNLKTLAAIGFKRDVGVTVTGYVAAVSNGAALTEYAGFYLASAGTAARFAGADGGVGQWDQAASNAYTPGTASDIAQSWATNSVRMSKDGVAQTADTTATTPSPTQLDIGNIGGSFQLNGNVGGIYGWTRNLSQSELNAITA